MSRDGSGVGRRDQHSEDSRRAILKAARLAFAQKGYTATSLEDIVGPARLTKGALYHHFANKAALLEALYVEMEEQLVVHVQRRIEEAGDDARMRMSIALDAFLDASSEPAYVSIVLRDAPTVLGIRHGRALDHAIGLSFVIELVRAFDADGMLPKISIEATARMLLAAASEVAVSMAYSEDPAQTRAEGHAVVMALFEGLAMKAQAEREAALGHAQPEAAPAHAQREAAPGRAGRDAAQPSATTAHSVKPTATESRARRSASRRQPRS